MSLIEIVQTAGLFIAGVSMIVYVIAFIFIHGGKS